jgi:hypothetical protein
MQLDLLEKLADLAARQAGLRLEGLQLPLKRRRPVALGFAGDRVNALTVPP